MAMNARLSCCRRSQSRSAAAMPASLSSLCCLLLLASETSAFGGCGGRLAGIAPLANPKYTRSWRHRGNCDPLLGRTVARCAAKGKVSAHLRAAPSGDSSSSSASSTNESTDGDDEDEDRPENHRTPFGKAYAIYRSYLRRLWSETSTEERRRIARDRATAAVRRVEHVMKGEEYADLTNVGDGSTRAWESGGEVSEERLELARVQMLEACELMLEAMEDGEAEEAKKEAATIDPGESEYLHSLDETGPHADAGTVDLGESEYLHSLETGQEEEEGEEETELQIPLPPMMDPGSKTFTVEFPVDIATPDEAVGDQVKQLVTTDGSGSAAPAKKKPRRSILFGAVMGALVACWVFSGNYIFTGVFTLMTILGQLEYYRMVINTGVYPARRISVLGAASMFLTALFAPDLHQICLPFFALVSMVWFLTMRRQVSTIPEISTTFTGMFLLGYIPSFWVRIRLIGGGREPTRLAPLVEALLNFLGRGAETTPAKILPSFLPKTVHLPITTGAVFIFWTWLCIAFSDVGAYFVGRSYGKTKLSEVAPAAGAASPNKTVEGVIGGSVVSAVLATFGAWVQRWPYWYVTGPIHGIYLGVLGLLGDLTASMIKRDAGIKDFGDLIPEHGGVMDRVDSYLFAAPYSWIVCKYLIPELSRWTKAGHVAASAAGVGVMSIPLVLFFSLRRILLIREQRHKEKAA